MKNFVFVSFCSWPWKQVSIVSNENKNYRPVSVIGVLCTGRRGRNRDISFIGDEGLDVNYHENLYLVGAVG